MQVFEYTCTLEAVKQNSVRKYVCMCIYSHERRGCTAQFD